jgi:hypothetical protein
MSFDGQVLWTATETTQPGQNAIRVNPVKMPAGLYLVRLRTPEGDLSRKLIVN